MYLAISLKEIEPVRPLTKLFWERGISSYAMPTFYLYIMFLISADSRLTKEERKREN